jgi:hypothetical protein
VGRKKKKMEENKKIDWNLLHLAPEEERNKINEKLEDIKQKRGQIITWALEIEELLEGILTNYFINPYTKKAKFFEVEIMRDMKFETKKQIFQKILEKENYENEISKKIISLIQNIQKMRNKVAHWRIFVFLQKGEVKLRKKQSLEDEMFSLTPEMLIELEKDKENIFQEAIKFNRWLGEKEVKKFNEECKNYVETKRFLEEK